MLRKKKKAPAPLSAEELTQAISSSTTLTELLSLLELPPPPSEQPSPTPSPSPDTVVSFDEPPPQDNVTWVRHPRIPSLWLPFPK